MKNTVSQPGSPTLASGERLTLYQLYRSWPDRQRFRGSRQEALLFHAWLFTERRQSRLDPTHCTVTNIREFLILYYHVLNEAELTDETLPVSDMPARKPIQAQPVSNENHRSEARIENNVGVLMRVVECADSSLLGISARGTTLDLCQHGLRIQSDQTLLDQSMLDQALPDSSELDIVITPRGVPFTFYNLVGQPRWVRQQGDQVITGIELRQKNDFPRWQSEFASRFESEAARPG